MYGWERLSRPMVLQCRVMSAYTKVTKVEVVVAIGALVLPTLSANVRRVLLAIDVNSKYLALLWLQKSEVAVAGNQNNLYFFQTAQ